MKVVVTGAAGFLGSRLVDALLSKESPLNVTELLLVDVQQPSPRQDQRVRCLVLDMSAPDAADRLVTPDCNVVFHLAAIVSGDSEADFDLGFRVNFDATRALLEAARRNAPKVKIIFTSTIGVFGGHMPAVLDDLTAVTPQNSYGTAKAMCELLINDYSRKGFVDGRFVRLPAVNVRAGAPDLAVRSFASGIIREPLNGQVAVCPVNEDLEIWLASSRTVISNIIHAATLPGTAFGPWRGVNLPGITVTVKDMVDALRTVAGDAVAKLVKFEPHQVINRIATTFATRIDNTRALALGFSVDKNYEDVIRAYIRDDLKKSA